MSMEYLDVMFVLQFFIYFGLIGYKLLNIIRQGILYKIDIFILTWILTFFCYGLGFICTILNYEVWSQGVLFSLQTYSLLILIVIFFAELFLYIKKDAIPAANSKKSNLSNPSN